MGGHVTQLETKGNNPWIQILHEHQFGSNVSSGNLRRNQGGCWNHSNNTKACKCLQNQNTFTAFSHSSFSLGQNLQRPRMRQSSRSCKFIRVCWDTIQNGGAGVFWVGGWDNNKKRCAFLICWGGSAVQACVRRPLIKRDSGHSRGKQQEADGCRLLDCWCKSAVCVCVCWDLKIPWPLDQRWVSLFMDHNSSGQTIYHTCEWHPAVFPLHPLQIISLRICVVVVNGEWEPLKSGFKDRGSIT